MKAEKILKVLNTIKVEDYNSFMEVEQLKNDCLAEIRKEANKVAGKASIEKVFNSIYKNALKISNNKSLHGAWMDTDNKQYITDGHRIVRVSNSIEFQEIDKETCTHIDGKKIFSFDLSAYKEVEIPTLKELQAELKIIKAEDVGKVKKYGYLLNKGITVNFQYLVDIRQAYTDDIHVYVDKDFSPIYICNSDKTIETILLPIKFNEDRIKDGKKCFIIG